MPPILPCSTGARQQPCMPIRDSVCSSNAHSPSSIPFRLYNGGKGICPQVGFPGIRQDSEQVRMPVLRGVHVTNPAVSLSPLLHNLLSDKMSAWCPSACAYTGTENTGCTTSMSLTSSCMAGQVSQHPFLRRWGACCWLWRSTAAFTPPTYSGVASSAPVQQSLFCMCLPSFGCIQVESTLQNCPTPPISVSQACIPFPSQGQVHVAKVHCIPSSSCRVNLACSMIRKFAS